MQLGSTSNMTVKFFLKTKSSSLSKLENLFGANEIINSYDRKKLNLESFCISHSECFLLYSPPTVFVAKMLPPCSKGKHLRIQSNCYA